MGLGIWDLGYGIWAMGHGIWDLGYGIHSLDSPQSRNPLDKTTSLHFWMFLPLILQPLKRLHHFPSAGAPSNLPVSPKALGRVCEFCNPVSFPPQERQSRAAVNQNCFRSIPRAPLFFFFFLRWEHKILQICTWQGPRLLLQQVRPEDSFFFPTHLLLLPMKFEHGALSCAITEPWERQLSQAQID